MRVLSPTFPGSIHICEECNAVLAYSTQDIYENHFIYCPLCKTKQKCNLDLNYNGVINNANNSKTK